MERGERELKGKESERRLSASVMNSPSAFVHGYAWPPCWLRLGSPTMAYIYKEFVQYMTMYTMCLSYKGVLYLECWPNVLFHSIVVGVEHCI